MHYFPVALPLLIVFAALLVVAVALIELYVLHYAYRRMGMHPRYFMLFLLLSLVGSWVNVPVARLPDEHVVTRTVVDLFGVPYVLPVVHDWPGTLVAINVGGAIVPAALSLYLVARNRLWLRSIAAIAVVAIAVHLLARPVPGVGIVVPTLAPPLVAAAAAMVFAWRRAPPLAYVAGSMGTLLGADVANLGRIQGLGAPIASIGGAGTYDGIFLTGILAVLLSPIGSAGAPERPFISAQHPHESGDG